MHRGIQKAFGQQVRRLRQAKGFSQEELAERCGLHRTYVGAVERGERNLSLQSMARLAKALDADIADFFVGGAS